MWSLLSNGRTYWPHVASLSTIWQLKKWCRFWHSWRLSYLCAAALAFSDITLLPARCEDGIDNAVVLKTKPGHQLPLFGVLNASRRMHKVVVSVRVTAFDNWCQQLPSLWRVMQLSARALLRLLLRLPYQALFQKTAAFKFLSSSSVDSHRRRTYPVEAIRESTEKSLLLVGWRPTKP